MVARDGKDRRVMLNLYDNPAFDNRAEWYLLWSYCSVGRGEVLEGIIGGVIEGWIFR